MKPRAPRPGNLRRPGAPFVEFSFYFADRTGVDAMRDVVLQLLGSGARFLGRTDMATEAGIRALPFSSATTPDPDEHRLSETELRASLDDPTKRVVRLEVSRAVGVIPEALEIVALIGTSRASVRHAVAIWSEGTLFSLPGAEREMRAQERKLHRRFLELVALLSPSYAAITVDWPMETPEDLAAPGAKDSISFMTFHVAEVFVGAEGLARISALAEGARVERTATGLFVSSTGRVPKEDAFRISRDVGRILARIR